MGAIKYCICANCTISFAAIKLKETKRENRHGKSRQKNAGLRPECGKKRGYIWQNRVETVSETIP